MSHPVPPAGRTDEWYTPRKIFEPLHREFRFTLDACATQESRKVERYFSKEQNGLVQPWAGERVWCNPPYSRENLPKWVAKCAQEAAQAEAVVAFLPSTTGVRWWHQHVEPGRLAGTVEVRFLQGRVRFGWPGVPEGHPACSAAFGSVLVIWRKAGPP